MKKRWIALAVLLGTGIGLLVLGMGMYALLGLFDLTFRPWVFTAAWIVLPLFGIAALCAAIRIFWALACRKNSEDHPAVFWQRIGSVFGIVLCLGAMVLPSRLWFLGLAFSCQPEHRVEREGKQMRRWLTAFYA